MKRNKLFTLIFLCQIALFAANSIALAMQDQEEKFTQKLQQLIRDLENNLIINNPFNEKLKLLVIDFSYNQDGVEARSALSLFLSDKFEALLADNKKFAIIEQNEVNKIIKSRDWTVEPVIPSMPENVGIVAGAEYVLTGRFEQSQNNLRIYTSIRDVRKREVISDASIVVPADLVPTVVPIVSENQDNVDFSDLKDISTDSTGQLDLQVFANHAPENVYKIGEQLIFYVKANRTCYIHTIYRDAEGNNVLLYPRRVLDKGMVKADSLYKIPPDNSFRIIISKPLGTECLKIFASNKPFGDVPDVDAAALRKRGVQIEGENQSNLYVEKNLTIRVVE